MKTKLPGFVGSQTKCEATVASGLGQLASLGKEGIEVVDGTGAGTAGAGTAGVGATG